MAKTKIDTAGLYAALDAERTARAWSWRRLAKEIGTSPSMLSRLGNEQRPDVDGFASLVRWLNVPAETFMMDADTVSAIQHEPDLVTQLAPLLRARHDLDNKDVAYLEEVIRATLKHMHASPEDMV
jgi:transcriptional regulator with XRE-family HTH domain